MSYRVTENVIIPFKVYCNIIETPIHDNPSAPQSIDLDLNVKALFDKSLFAQDVVIKSRSLKMLQMLKLMLILEKLNMSMIKEQSYGELKKFSERRTAN